MIKSLRLSWLKRIFSDNSGACQNYLEYLPKETGSLVLFNCNDNAKDLAISSQFYVELLKWWSEFRKDNAVETNWLYRIWSNQEIGINNKLVYYKKYFNYGIQTVGDLRFDLNNIDSCEVIAKHNIQQTHFLEWTGLRHFVLLVSRHAYRNPDHTALNRSFKIDCDFFDVTKKKSKDSYSLFVRRLAFQITQEN